MTKKYKLVVFVPVTHADKVREAIGKAGAGRIGNYSFCSFTTKGTGRFKPEERAKPFIGKVRELEQVEEERVEAICDERVISEVVAAMKSAHPYEEVAYDLYSLEILDNRKIINKRKQL